MERVARIPCRDQSLIGILHSPDSASPRGALVFVNAGARARRGPYGLYTRCARRLTDAGYYVLRFDPLGMGDSPGNLESVAAYRDRVCDGMDPGVSGAVDYLREVSGFDEIGMFGLCGGANAALFAACEHPCVKYLVLVSMPVMNIDYASERGAIDAYTQAFLRNAVSPRSWYRLLTGRSNYRWLVKTGRRLLFGRYQRSPLHEGLWGATEKYLFRGDEVFFVYGSNDPFYPWFAQEYRQRLEKLKGSGIRIEIEIIAGAMHTFAQSRHQKELMARMCEWLDRREGPRGRARADVAGMSIGSMP